MNASQYAATLMASGMSEREAARAYFYADRYGMSAVSGDDNGSCVVFAKPSCGNWNCLNPVHQQLEATP